MSVQLRSALALLTLLATALPTGAQLCFGPDNLSGPCCAPTADVLPAFPPTSLPGRGLCWSQCNLGAQPTIRVNISPPVQTLCGQFVAKVDVFDAGGAPILTGPMTLDYTRTWAEGTAVGSIDYQVWRFVAKADLSRIPGVPPACPIPSCLPAHPTAFFYGYVDYALQCGSINFEQSVVLYHNCDRFIHTPGISDKPGVFHPGVSYAIVAPDTTVNPFVPALIVPPAGILTAEAVRDVGTTASPLCIDEEPISSGTHLPIFQGCACPLGLAPPKNSVNLFDGIGSCPDASGLVSSFKARDTTPMGFPWVYMLGTSIGSWTTGASYPGPERVIVNEGVFDYYDACVLPAPAVGKFIDVMYGATTQSGYFVVPSPLTPLTDRFIDMASNFAKPAGVPAVPPFIGSVRPTRHLIYANVL